MLVWLLANYKPVLKATSYALVAVVAFCSGCSCRGKWDDVFSAQAPIGAMGWVDLPDQVDQVRSTLANPNFADAAAGIMRDTNGGDALLYLAGEIPAHNQLSVGCCVGEGATRSAEARQKVQITKGEPADFLMLASESVYAFSRVNVGRGRLRGRDGSVGAWAAQALMQYGVLARKRYEVRGRVYDLSEFSEERARQWGDRGVPPELHAEAAKHKAGAIANVRSAEEARVALKNGYPIFVCSLKGFTTVRDRDGFCAERGRWAHCMACCGYRADKKGFLLIQSWGPNNPTGPRTLNQPSNSFWITWRTMDEICREGDTWAVSQFQTFKKQSIDFLVQAPKEGRSWLARSLLSQLPWSLRN